MIACRHLLGWLLSPFRSRRDLILKNLALRQQLWALHAPTASPATDDGTQAVLGRHAQGLVWMETAAHLGHTQNRRPLAWRRLSVVRKVDFTSQAKRRPKAYKQGDSGVDFSDGEPGTEMCAGSKQEALNKGFKEAAYNINRGRFSAQKLTGKSANLRKIPRGIALL